MDNIFFLFNLLNSGEPFVIEKDRLYLIDSEQTQTNYSLNISKKNYLLEQSEKISKLEKIFYKSISSSLKKDMIKYLNEKVKDSNLVRQISNLNIGSKNYNIDFYVKPKAIEFFSKFKLGKGKVHQNLLDMESIQNEITKANQKISRFTLDDLVLDYNELKGTNLSIFDEFTNSANFLGFIGDIYSLSYVKNQTNSVVTIKNKNYILGEKKRLKKFIHDYHIFFETKIKNLIQKKITTKISKIENDSSLIKDINTLRTRVVSEYNSLKILKFENNGVSFQIPKYIIKKNNEYYIFDGCKVSMGLAYREDSVLLLNKPMVSSKATYSHMFCYSNNTLCYRSDYRWKTKGIEFGKPYPIDNKENSEYAGKIIGLAMSEATKVLYKGYHGSPAPVKNISSFNSRKISKEKALASSLEIFDNN